MLLNGLAKVFSRDWCIELEDEGKVIDDHRPLLAGMILLLEQLIVHDRAHQAREMRTGLVGNKRNRERIR
jgi:hypothetical protein